MKKKLNLIIVDDHTLFRRGMAKMVSSFEMVSQVHEASNGKELLKMLKTISCDMILLDLEMPIMDGLEAANQVLVKYPDVRIIMLSMHASENIVNEMMNTGIHSYLIKNSEPEEVKEAIQSVMEKGFFYNELIARSLQSGIKKQVEANKKGFNSKIALTARETEVLRLICDELTMKQIADKINVSENTVQNHRTSLLRKTGAKNTVGLVRYAFENNLLE